MLSGALRKEAHNYPHTSLKSIMNYDSAGHFGETVHVNAAVETCLVSW